MVKILTVSNVSFESSLNEQAKNLRQGRQQNKHAPTRCLKRPVQLHAFLGLEEEVFKLELCATDFCTLLAPFSIDACDDC